MTCYSPSIAQQLAPGRRPVFTGFDFSKPLMRLPCGRCIGCRVARSQAWALRAAAEAQTAGEYRSLFVTNTYADNPFSLSIRDHQLYMKKLRHSFPGVRFMVGAEYGTTVISPVTGFGRPHYHYLLFGLDVPDLVPLGGKNPAFRSETLTRIWGHGHVDIGLVTFGSAAYALRYIHKKRLGPDAADYYSFVHPETGERSKLVPPFQRQSLKPGIGAEWFSRFHSDVYPSDKFPLKGGKFAKPPKYFDTLYERLSEKDPSMPSLDSLKEKRVERIEFRADDFTDARLKVREQCAIARAKFYSREKL